MRLQLTASRQKSAWLVLRLLLAAGITLAGVHPRSSNADAVTGTWTGDAQVRGNYYWDRSTRVLAPEIIAQLGDTSS